MNLDSSLRIDVRNVNWFGKVRTPEEAARVLKWAPLAFYAFAALFVFDALAVGPMALLAFAGAVAICAVLIQLAKSRVAAIVMLAITGLVIVGAVQRVSAGSLDVGRAIFVLVVLVNAITVLRATFVYRAQAAAAGAAAAAARPSRWYYAIALGVLVVTGVVDVWFIYTYGSRMMAATQQLVVPGAWEIELREPGPHTIYYESRSVVGGKIYATGGVTGLNVEVASKATGVRVALASPSTPTTYTFGSRSGTALFEFPVPAPGTYVVSAGYARPPGPEIVLAVGRAGWLTWVLGGAAGIAFGGAAMALTVLVVVFVKRRRAHP